MTTDPSRPEPWRPEPNGTLHDLFESYENRHAANMVLLADSDLRAHPGSTPETRIEQLRADADGQREMIVSPVELRRRVTTAQHGSRFGREKRVEDTRNKNAKTRRDNFEHGVNAQRMYGTAEAISLLVVDPRGQVAQAHADIVASTERIDALHVTVGQHALGACDMGGDLAEVWFKNRKDDIRTVAGALPHGEQRVDVLRSIGAMTGMLAYAHQTPNPQSLATTAGLLEEITSSHQPSTDAEQEALNSITHAIDVQNPHFAQEAGASSTVTR